MVGETSSAREKKNEEKVQQSEATLPKDNETLPQKLKEKVKFQKEKIDQSETVKAKNKEHLKKQLRVVNKNEEKKVSQQRAAAE